MPAANPPERSPSEFPHFNNIYLFGVFMTGWSVLESVIQAGIMKQLGVDARKAVVVTGKLQFGQRVQLLVGLLKEKGTFDQAAVKTLTALEKLGKRNIIVHGTIDVGTPGVLTFIKYDGGASERKSFSVEEMKSHIVNLTQKTDELMHMLNVDVSDIHQIGEATLSFAEPRKK